MGTPPTPYRGEAAVEYVPMLGKAVEWSRWRVGHPKRLTSRTRGRHLPLLPGAVDPGGVTAVYTFLSPSSQLLPGGCGCRRRAGGDIERRGWVPSGGPSPTLSLLSARPCAPARFAERVGFLGEQFERSRIQPLGRPRRRSSGARPPALRLDRRRPEAGVGAEARSSCRSRRGTACPTGPSKCAACNLCAALSCSSLVVVPSWPLPSRPSIGSARKGRGLEPPGRCVRLRRSHPCR